MVQKLLRTKEIQNLRRVSNDTGDRLIMTDIQFASYYRFVGRKSRTKEQLQLLMRNEEIGNWLAESSRDEAKHRAVLDAEISKELQRQSSGGYEQQLRRESHGSFALVGWVVVQVVEDEDEVTTIRRDILPDLCTPTQGSSTTLTHD